MSTAIGIDLGTTYSAVAVLRPTGEAEILPNREGDKITPSVIQFHDGGGKDEPLVGIMAKHSAAALPHDVVQYVKRQMGDKSYRFQSASGATYSPEELSAIILRRLKEDAEIALGHPVRDAVITVPAYFDDSRRTATKDAGKIAGLNVLRVLNEPTAAALSFGLDTAANGTVLVYDLGGGTFDVTLMRIQGGSFEVIGTEGDRNLGGFDFDNRLMEFVAEAAQGQGIDGVLEDDQTVAELREKAEMAKRSLTTVPSTFVHLSTGGRSARVAVTRGDFERITADLLRRTEEIVDYVLEDAGHTWSQIDHVLLVGGSTRMPMVRELMHRLSGRAPALQVNPDEAVALGAAIQAAIEASTGEGTAPQLDGNPVVVQDVTSQALGVITVDGTGAPVNSVIIPANAKIPAKRSQRFNTVTEQQTRLEVQVTQGDDPDPDFVTEVGTKTLTIPPYPKGAPVEVIYAYDIDQTIFVEVIDLTAGTSLGTFEIDRNNNLDASEVTAAIAKMSATTVL